MVTGGDFSDNPWLRLGRHSELLGELTALTMEHPFRERMWTQLMLALYRCGRRADALLATASSISAPVRHKPIGH
ncbi:BTAD domain-containing putative transcriptional regulator [Streptomyces sp. NPDC054847]